MRHCFFVGLVSMLTVMPVAGQDTDDLIKQLKDPESKVRRLAAEKLGRQQIEAAIPNLAALLSDDEREVRQAAADALASLGPKSVGALSTAIDSPKASTRLIAIATLIEIAPHAKGAVPALTAALKDKTIDVRIHAAYALGKIGADARPALPALYEAAKDLGNIGAVARQRMPSSVAVAAVDAALRIDRQCGEALAKEALPELVKGLRHKDAGTVEAAAYALSRLGAHARSALPALEEAEKSAPNSAASALKFAIADIKSESENQAEIVTNTKLPVEKRLQALRKLTRSKQPPEKILPLLLSLLRDDEPRIRHDVVEHIHDAKLKSKELITALIERLDDESLEKAGSGKSSGSGDLVAETLAGMGKDAALALAAALGNQKSKPLVRFNAARALSLMGRNAAVARDELETALGDRLIAIAIESGCAFVRSGGDFAKAKPILAEGLKHKSTFVAFTAGAALERIGLPGKEMVPELTLALEHNDREVRIMACRALGKMGPAAEPAVPAMAALLKGADGRQRYQVSEVLNQMGPLAKPAMPILVDQLNNLDKMSPNPILSLLGKIGPDAKEAVPALIDLLKQDDSFMGDQAMQTLGQIGPAAKDAVPLIIAVLADKSEYRRKKAARALGELGSAAEAGVPKLTEALDDSSKRVRVWAAFALARITGQAEKNVKRMIECWRESSSEKPDFGSANYDVAEALVLLGPLARPARDLMLKGLANPDTPLGTYHLLTQAIGNLQDDAVFIVPELLTLLDSKVEDFAARGRQLFLIEALGAFGPKAKAALPRLNRYLEGDDEKTATAAAEAIWKINGKDGK